MPDWENIALNGRRAYIVFDSDVMTKVEVYHALARLKAFLEKRSARVLLTYLPSGEGATKVGLDDFLAAGNTKDDLLALATSELRPLPGSGADDDGQLYRETPAGIVYMKPTQNGSIETPLAIFTARILADVVRDDGAETEQAFEVEAKLGEREYLCTVPAGRFSAMHWPIEVMGGRAIVYAGFGARDHARVAIQALPGPLACSAVHC